MIIDHLGLPPAKAKNLAFFCDSNSSRFLELLSAAAAREKSFSCSVPGSLTIEARPEMVNLIKDLLDGMDYMGSGQFLEARQLYARLLSNYPFDLTQYGNLASACIQLRDFPAAWELLAQAWRMSPKNWTILVCMVDYFYSMGNYEQAEKCSLLLQEYGNLEPVGVAALALAQWKMGKKAVAMETARLLLPQLTPELAASHVFFQELQDIVKSQG
jgi:tetratricopeptide (TPR) repeat protein